MEERLRNNMVARMAAELDAGTLSNYERAVLAAFTELGMEFEHAASYAAIFGGPTG